MIKKGFTLIELLAVIIILAVIAVISMPIITDLI
ncbi:MAG: prepilin-type N-terminal cleavage/methylation domain-containing protein, partial [Bacilli bacterium]|nr:prepilin-type N-terminal cleavage/methylation domain-containing protein [Bacilli bacterium]